MRRLCTVLAVLAAAVALPGAAYASLSCADGTTKRPFLPLLANALAPLDLDDGTAEVAFRFKPSGLMAAWQIDDVYVDPFRVR